jgi:hypothetical protein
MLDPINNCAIDKLDSGRRYFMQMPNCTRPRSRHRNSEFASAFAVRIPSFLRSSRLCGLGLTCLVATAIVGHAENAVVLESFEDNVSSASPVSIPGGRPTMTPPGVTLSAYAKQGNEDENVTHGRKSLKIVLSGRQKHSPDFQIKLSDEASARVRAAMASPDVARYILRYDLIFPPLENFEYFNSGVQFGDCRDVLISAGGKRTMSIALDLLTGIPPAGPLTLVVSDDFTFKPAFTNVTIYLDNVRLVDTYAPGARATTHVLQSFENSTNVLGGAAHFNEWDKDHPLTRTALAQYAALSASDVRVTEGSHALEITTATPGVWHADFIIPFDKTQLAEVLKLDRSQNERPGPADLARYTLRWDVTFPDLYNEWMNCTYHTLQTFLPIIQVRQSKPGIIRQTYSVTLDQTEWGSFKEIAPQLVFITEGPQKAKNIKVYYDNFRLIDTATVPTVDAKPPGPASASSGGR